MQVYIGIDWSEKKHDVAFMNPVGEVIARLTLPHRLEGFVQLEATCRKLGLAPSECVVGLETAHNLFIDYLWSREFAQLYVLPPSLVQGNRSRFGQSGAKDDPGEARLIADILRTDRSRLQPWHPDSLLTRHMRAKISLVLQLTKQTTRLANRLRAVLLRYYPAALQVFKSGLSAQITSEFVLAYPTPAEGQALSYAAFEDFARQHAYSDPAQLPGCYQRLQADYPPASSQTVQIYQSEARLLAQLLLKTTRAKLSQLAELQTLYRQHPHYATFASLPAAGRLIGPGLLVKFGDDRQRFPQPSSVQALAGTCPVTERSGKRRIVKFRHACDKEWRYLCHEWAMALVNKTRAPLAVAYYERIRPHCHSERHAYRCVANRWLAVAWKLWSTSQTYDAAYHFQQSAARRKPRR